MISFDIDSVALLSIFPKVSYIPPKLVERVSNVKLPKVVKDPIALSTDVLTSPTRVFAVVRLSVSVLNGDSIKLYSDLSQSSVYPLLS